MSVMSARMVRPRRGGAIGMGAFLTCTPGIAGFGDLDLHAYVMA
jgi:hypothetical protein